jgi:hypothetical protein
VPSASSADRNRGGSLQNHLILPPYAKQQKGLTYVKRCGNASAIGRHARWAPRPPVGRSRSMGSGLAVRSSGEE